MFTFLLASSNTVFSSILQMHKSFTINFTEKARVCMLMLRVAKDKNNPIKFYHSKTIMPTQDFLLLYF